MDTAEILPVIERLANDLSLPVYLVGGAVRDELMGLRPHDLDFVMPEPTEKLARKAADSLGAAFYRLDPSRHASRVVISSLDGPQFIDFTPFAGVDLQSDLAARDFTVNAMARRLGEPGLIDPLSGQRDLRVREIRACRLDSLSNDPVRALRAVRQAVVFGFSIEKVTWQLAKKAARQLPVVSAERLRDELVRMLENDRASVCIRMLEEMGALPATLPELLPLIGLKQSPPHIWDVWDHTLAALDCLEKLLGGVTAADGDDPFVQMAVKRLGRYVPRLREHFAEPLPNGRKPIGLLKLAALYHDTGKPEKRFIDEQGNPHFYGHDDVGARIVGPRMRALAYSTGEIDRAATIVREHMRIHHLTLSHGLTPRAMYRFWRDCGPAGVDVCLLSLADLWAVYGSTITPEIWEGELAICAALMEAYWDRHEVSRPTALVDGDELMKRLSIRPGPLVGQLLEAIREAQAEGQVTDKESALAYAARWCEENDGGNNRWKT